MKNLILYHTEEKTLANRKENYTREAAENFKGRIFVPDDLMVIKFLWVQKKALIYNIEKMTWSRMCL